MNDTGKNIRVLVADDHEIMRMGLASLLETDGKIDVVGEATQEIKSVMPETRILLLTTFGTADGLAHAIEAGPQKAPSEELSSNLLPLPSAYPIRRSRTRRTSVVGARLRLGKYAIGSHPRPGHRLVLAQLDTRLLGLLLRRLLFSVSLLCRLLSQPLSLKS